MNRHRHARRARSARPRPVLAAALASILGLAGWGPLPGSDQRLTEDRVEDPSRAVFSTRDVENFLEAMAAIAAGRDVEEALATLYFERASPGLEMFVEKYDLTLERLSKAMEEHPEAYARLPETLRQLRLHEEEFRAAYAALAREVPDAVFPPTWFLVAAHRGIGSGSVEGPLVSIEKETPESISRDLSATLVHEMVHMQQLAAVGERYFEIFSGPGRTLLALSIREGAATWLAERITGGSEHKNAARDFLLAHEPALWASFRKVMLGPETGDWLWSDPLDPDQPRDVGYALGARIVATYHENAGDRSRAMREILGVTDYPALLARSGYAERIERVAARAAAPPSAADLAWLSGCWAAEGGEPGSGEQWTDPAGGTMLGLNRTVRSGRTVAHEFLEIRETDAGGIVYVAHPSGQEGTVFGMTRSSAGEVVFENPEHDFPQRVLYRLGEDGRLLGRIEGERDGESRGVDFPMRRAPCAGAPPRPRRPAPERPSVE